MLTDGVVLARITGALVHSRLASRAHIARQADALELKRIVVGRLAQATVETCRVGARIECDLTIGTRVAGGTVARVAALARRGKASATISARRAHARIYDVLASCVRVARQARALE